MICFIHTYCHSFLLGCFCNHYLFHSIGQYRSIPLTVDFQRILIAPPLSSPDDTDSSNGMYMCKNAVFTDFHLCTARVSLCFICDLCSALVSSSPSSGSDLTRFSPE